MNIKFVEEYFNTIIIVCITYCIIYKLITKTIYNIEKKLNLFEISNNVCITQNVINMQNIRQSVNNIEHVITDNQSIINTTKEKVELIEETVCMIEGNLNDVESALNTTNFALDIIEDKLKNIIDSSNDIHYKLIELFDSIDDIQEENKIFKNKLENEFNNFRMDNNTFAKDIRNKLNLILQNMNKPNE